MTQNGLAMLLYLKTYYFSIDSPEKMERKNHLDKKYNYLIASIAVVGSMRSKRQ